jgi:hypothetical protein
MNNNTLCASTTEVEPSMLLFVLEVGLMTISDGVTNNRLVKFTMYINCNVKLKRI